jgi:lipopolysaccharide/colanic/teichoic acid biosynthesis glycosyltransferase
MTGNKYGKWVNEVELRITKVGSFLRKSRIDELPQIVSVLKGDSSLIGPRADLGGLSVKLIESIPYYQVRYVVKPGLSGWAQVTQEGLPPQGVDETRIRLSYDLFYIKNRSVWLDILIALKTIKTLSMRVGI